MDTRYQKYNTSEKGKDRHAAYAKSAAGKARLKKYLESPKGKAAHLKAILKYRSRPDGLLKRRAVHAITNAVRDGRVIKLPCIICGEIKVEAHHEDYNKPLDVKWLCPKHHRRLHRGQFRLLPPPPINIERT